MLLGENGKIVILSQVCQIGKSLLSKILSFPCIKCCQTNLLNFSGAAQLISFFSLIKANNLQIISKDSNSLYVFAVQASLCDQKMSLVPDIAILQFKVLPASIVEI